MTATAAEGVHDALEDVVVRRGGLLRVAQVRRDALRRLYPVALQDASGVFEGRRVWGRKAARDGRRVVADHVGEQEGYGRGRVGETHEAATLQDRDVL